MTGVAGPRAPGRAAAVARNTAWNLLGALLPIPVALVCIPLLLGALGVERFGVLGIAWMMLGYFGMFDFGLSLSTTRFVAAAVARGERAGVRSLLRASLLLHAVLGLAGGLLFSLLAPWLAASVFALPAPLVDETRNALYWLAASVSAIVVTAAFRGVLEGLQRFDLVNLIRIPASVINYAGPLIALAFGTGLPLVVAVIVVARFAVLGAYAIACLRFLPRAPTPSHVTRKELGGLATYGGWLAVSGLVNPLIIAADRFIIAAAVSVAAVAYYVTPYEVITKAWILSASLLNALFPVFAGLPPDELRSACRAAQRYLLTLATPLIVLVLGSADVLLEWWLGSEFREASTFVARLLALGILVNIVAQVPLTVLNATGRAHVAAWIATLELPFYVGAIWWAAQHYGIDGVAAVWAARACVDAGLLFFAARIGTAASFPTYLCICGFLATALFVAIGLDDSLALRFTALAVLLTALGVWEWRVLLDPQDRVGFLNLMRRLLTTRPR